MALYNFEWQALRTSLDFSTYEKTADSIGKLEWYLKSAGVYNIHVTYTRIYQVLNLMSAVRMGFAGATKLARNLDKRKAIQRKDDAALTFREMLSDMYSDYQSRRAKLQVDSTAKELYDMRQASKADLERVYSSLLERWNKSGQAATRPQLGDYVGLIEKVRKEWDYSFA